MDAMLEMRGITKRFPGVIANDAVDFDVVPGEIHTLLGENGAGKTTLMRILYGLSQPDEGDILLSGQRVSITSPAEAIDHGIGMVHQHFMLVPSLTVVENVALGIPSSRGPLTDLETVSDRLEELGDQYGLRVHLDVEVWRLSVGERQRVEILKALFREARLLVLDEPTAVLTPQESDELFGTLSQMAADGRGIVFISHKLREVLAVSSRITVLRQGKVVGATTPAESTRESLAKLMVGRDVSLVPERDEHQPTEVRLAMRGVTARNDRGEVALESFDMEVRGGEILGIAGVSGNGQRELAEVVAGLRPVEAGVVEIMGKDATGLGVRKRRRSGLAYVPEERMREGAIGEFSVAENLVLIDHADPRFAKRGMLRLGEIRRHGRDRIEEFSVKTPSLDARGRTLSGGNIQKMILARELSSRPKVILAAQPTRGVDVGAAEYIHNRLIEARDNDVAVVVISEDLDEVLGIADRILVLYEGRLAGIVDAADADRTRLGLMMAGASA